MTPFPENDIYRVQVFGDAFAEGLAPGLAEVMGSDARVQVARRHRPFGSLTRADWEDDIRDDEANRELTHVAVVMLGTWDRQNIRFYDGSRPIPFGSDAWRAEYGRRVDRMIQSLRKRRYAVYVVGLPVLRAPNDSARAEMQSEVLRQRAGANGAKFIDIFEAFAEEGGGYAQWGPDMSGTRVRLREGDGVSFTPAGNRKLAAFVERDLRRDIDQAVNDRAVPLAGDETEQRRISPARATAGVAVPSAWKGSVSVAANAKGPGGAAAPAGAATDASGDQKADNGRVAFRVLSAQGREETVTLDIPRPALSAAVVALVARRDVTAPRGQQVGESVIEDIGNGSVVVNSVSQIGDGTQSAAGRRRAAASRTPYEIALVKGETLPARPGRADDFAWPRNDTVPAPAAVMGPPAPTPPSRPGLPGRVAPQR
jgi:hypothetical protein